MTRNFILAPLLAVLALGAQAQTQKIGVINMQDALVATKDGQKAVADLRSKYSPKDQELQKRQQELTAKQEQYRKTQNTISEAAKATLERDIDSMQRTMQRDVDDVKQDMDADQQRMVNELGQKMMQVISKYAADNQFTAVFDVSGQPNNILYASNTADITQAVIALYDKAAPVTPSAPPSKAPATSSAIPRPSAPTAPKPAATIPAPLKK
ncbi:MAG: outer membrane protein [Bryobacterales bacterium]|jgi:outer membrane protein|nr:outer membrane protein [Bryobacterales bacterium]